VEKGRRWWNGKNIEAIHEQRNKYEKRDWKICKGLNIDKKDQFLKEYQKEENVIFISLRTKTTESEKQFIYGCKNKECSFQLLVAEPLKKVKNKKTVKIKVKVSNDHEHLDDSKEDEEGYFIIIQIIKFF